VVDAERTLTRRELNRATLARQLLLERAALPVADAVRRVAALQAQAQNPPYIGLWTRLRDFDRSELTRALHDREVVRATLMRSTIHIATAADYLRWRGPLHPALVRAFQGFHGGAARQLDAEPVVAAALELFAEEPRTFAELRSALAERWPDVRPETMAYAVRAHLPLVQVPPAGTWRHGGEIRYTLAEPWLGEAPAESPSPRELVLGYLAAFGPATVKDAQTWAGMTRLRPTFEELRPSLRVFRDEAGRELFDVPDGPLPGPATDAPPRFLPDFDNLILSHEDRSRFVPDEHRKKVFRPAGVVRATFLVDGTVRGTWKLERAKRTVTLVVEPFAPLAGPVRAALAEEAERLGRWATDDGEDAAVRFESPY
jgi:hypothetical protein